MLMKKYFITLIFIYSGHAFSNDIDCKKAINTLEVNYCASVELALRK